MDVAKARELLARAATRIGRPLALLLGLLVLVRVCAVLAKGLTFSEYSFDEQWFLWGGWSILQGLAPYKDFHDYKPPILFLSEAAALAIFGDEGQRFRYFMSGLAILSMASLAAALVRRGVGVLLSISVAGLVASVYLNPAYHDTGLNDVESIGLGYYLLGVAAMLEGRRSSAFQAVGSAFLALSVLTKEPFLFIAAPTYLAFACDGSGPRILRPLGPYLRASALGGLIPAAAVTLYLLACGSLGDYVEGYPRTRQFAATYAVMIGRFRPGSFGEEWRQNWNYLTAGLYNLAHLAPWLPLFGAGLVTTRRHRRSLMAAGVLAVVGGAYAITIGHCFWPHYFIMGVGGLALMAAVCALEIDSTPWRGAIGVAIALSIIPVLYPRYLSALASHPTPGGPSVPADVLDIIAKNTKPSDYIVGTQAGIYFFAKRRSALTFNTFLDELISTYPGDSDEDRLRRLGEQLRARRPRAVYIDPQFKARAVRHLSQMLFPFLKEMGYVEVRSGLYLGPTP